MNIMTGQEIVCSSDLENPQKWMNEKWIKLQIVKDVIEDLRSIRFVTKSDIADWLKKELGIN